MIQIAINPNTKIPSVAILLRGYFGLGKDGVKLVDSDVVFKPEDTKAIGWLPNTAFDMLQIEGQSNGNLTDKQGGRFQYGNTFGKGRKFGSKNKSKTPLADLMREVAESKHYKIKDTGEMIVANEIIAEKVVDKIVERLDVRLLEFFTERTEGKVTQGVKLSGGLSHGDISDEEMKRLNKLFPEQ